MPRLTTHKKYVVFSYLQIGCNIISGFILFPLILKNLGLSALGVFGLLFSIKSILDIGIGWLSGSITKNLLRYRYLRSDIYTLSTFVNALYGFLAFIIILSYGYFFKSEYFWSFFYFGLFAWFSFCITPFYELLIADLKQHQTAFLGFCSNFYLWFYQSVYFL